MRQSLIDIEKLESRMLFCGSGTSGAEAAAVVHSNTPAVSAIKTIVGPTLHFTAGVGWTGKVGFYATPVLDPPLAYSATIDWGDGTAISNATLAYGQQGTQFGEIITGSHSYAKAGTYAVKITFVEGPINSSLGLPTTILEYIDDKAIVAKPPAPVAAAIKTVVGPTLHLTAGTPFSGDVGFYATPLLDPPLGYSATIDWGDKTPISDATLAYGQQGTQFGEIISGQHSYAKAGTYAVRTTFVEGPIDPSSTLPARILEFIDDKAIVAKFPANSAGGVTIQESGGQTFTAVVGTFSFPAPATGLTASINWGDGSTSVGTITPTGVQGIDVINFEVTGTHSYALPGMYSIVIKISKPGPTPTATAVPPVVLTIDSTAIVSPVVTPVTS